MGKKGHSDDKPHRDGTNATDVISDYLVTFENVQELQQKNMQLLQITRKLAEDQERLETEGREGPESMKKALDAANKELASLREARIRTEDMVLGLVQQRDMYRAMVEESDKVDKRSPSNKMVPSNSAHTSPSKVQEMQRKITQAEDEKTRLSDRLRRYEDQEKSLNEMIEQNKEQLNALRKQAAYATVESKFQADRAANYEEAAKVAQQTVQTTLGRRAEVEGLLLAAQKESRVLNEKVLQCEHSVKVAEDHIQRLEIENQVAKTNETRLAQQVSEAREELRRQHSLSESMSRMESGLMARIEGEKNSLVEERDTLLKTVENLRKDLADNNLMGDQKIRSLEEELRETRSKMDEKTSECATAKEEMIREQGVAAAAQDRSNLLERQLGIAQERLASVQGAQTLDLIDLSTSAQNEIALSRAQTELSSVKAQLAAADEHMSQLKMISTATERTLSEVRERFASEKKILQDEKENALKELVDFKEEVEKSRGVEMELLKEVEKTRERENGLKKEHTAAIAQLEADANLAKTQASQAVSQMDVLKKEVSKFQAVARSATQNYERELQLHATDAAELRAMETEVDRVKAELEATSQRLTDISAGAIRKDKQMEDERQAFEMERAEIKESMASLQRTNDILHS